MGTYAIFVCLNLDWCGFICASFSGSPLSLSFTQCNIYNLGSYAPFTLPWQLRPQNTTVGFSVRWGGGGDGILHHAKAHPSRPLPKHRMYEQFNWIRLNVCSALIWARPNTPWAIKGNGWAIGTLSFPAHANTSITLHHFKLYKSKSGQQRRKINTVLCHC